MTTLIFLFVIAVALANGELQHPRADVPSDGNTTCHLWRTGTSCECGDTISNIVQCDGEHLSLKTCYCMTYSEELLVSYCLYTCTLDIHEEFRQIDTTNITELNSDVCKLYRRTGLMCGKCIKDHAPAVYSYNLACVNCTNYKYNVIKYVAVAYVPLTLFYLAVIVFRVPINSGAMITYVTISQIFASPGLITFYTVRFERNSIKYINGILTFLTFYTFWNLDFFRSLYTPFCLHPKLTTVDIISLDYIVGVYPLVLTVLTYLLVQLHDGSQLLMLVCMPLNKCMYRFRKVWNIKESLVKAFATFLVLSYVKIMNVSIELLTPAHGYYDLHGNRVNKTYLFSNGSMEYFGRDHIPYAVLAIIMTLVFNIIPLILLCTYPCRCCHKFPFKHHVLQGEFKEQPRDFSGFYIALRILNLVLYAVLKNPVYYLWAASALMFFSILLAVVKPYKTSFYNLFDPWLFFMLIMGYIAVSVRFESRYVTPKEALHSTGMMNLVLIIVTSSLPIYGVVLVLYRVIPSWKVKKLVAWVSSVFKHGHEMEDSLNFQRKEYARLS